MRRRRRQRVGKLRDQSDPLAASARPPAAVRSRSDRPLALVGAQRDETRMARYRYCERVPHDGSGSRGAHAAVRGQANRRNDELFWIGLDGYDRAARVHVAAEPMGALHREHVADLADAAERRNARQEILAERRRRPEHVRVAARELCNLRR
jgi:hypothetical protein